jgi:hypothetical protein
MHRFVPFQRTARLDVYYWIQAACQECSSTSSPSHCSTPNVFSPTGRIPDTTGYWDPVLAHRNAYGNPSMHSPTVMESPSLQMSPVSNYQNPVVSPSSSSAMYAALSVCHWGHCAGAFSTHSDLMAHVNESHLGLPFADSSVACHWGTCGVSLVEDLELKRRSGVDYGMSSILANHLLRDHLSDPRRSLPLIGSPPSEVHSPLSQAASAVDVPFSSQSSSSTMVDVEMSPRAGGLKGSKKRSASPQNHTCQWKGCANDCESAEELTKHLLEVHIRGGQTKYDCLWGECDRNGDKALSSKQKIMRHLQVCYRFSYSLSFPLITHIQSHTGHRPFECPDCGQHFSEAATLQQHQRRHTAESERNLTCERSMWLNATSRALPLRPSRL